MDAFGRQVELSKESGDWNLPTVVAKKGEDLELTLDADLQKARARCFLKASMARFVVLNPKNGEIPGNVK